MFCSLRLITTFSKQSQQNTLFVSFHFFFGCWIFSSYNFRALHLLNDYCGIEYNSITMVTTHMHIKEEHIITCQDIWLE